MSIDKGRVNLMEGEIQVQSEPGKILLILEFGAF